METGNAWSGFICELDSNSVFGICLDRFNHQVKLVSAVDLARHVPQLVRRDYLGFREVIEPIHAFGLTDGGIGQGAGVLTTTSWELVLLQKLMQSFS